LFGTNVAELFEIDVTGKLASELTEDKFNSTHDIPFYKNIAENFHLSRTSGTLHWQGRAYRKATFIELPLSDNDERATHMISMLISD